MKIEKLNSKKLFQEYLIEVPYDEIDNSINNKINEMISTITIPGFRKGKAPLNIVKKKYENNVLSEVIEKIALNKTKELIEEKKLKVFRQPKVEIKKYIRNEPIQLIIKIDLQPKINIYPYDKINLNKYNIDIDKKTFEDNFKTFLNSQKKYIKVDKNRTIKNTDKVFVNITTADKSVPNFFQSQKNIPIITDSDYQILPNLSERLIEKNCKVGDRLKLTFDLKNLLKEKNEKNAEFEIEILSIEENVDFKVDKGFLEKNNLTSEEELKNNINNNLLNQYENYLRQIEKKQLMDILERKNTFDVPDGILDEEFNLIWHKVEHAKKDNKLDDDDKKLNENQLKKRYEKIAFRRVKLAILIQHIANEQRISVTEKELQDGMINYASQYPGQEKQIFDYFKQNPGSIETVRGPIFEKKVVDFILSKTKQQKKTISLKEFNKLQEDTFNFNRDKNEKLV